MTETTIALKTGLNRRCIALKETVYQDATGRLRLMTGLTIEPEPQFFVAAEQPGGWQDLFCDSPDSLPLLVEHIQSRASTTPSNPDWENMCRTAADLVKSSKAGIRATVTAIRAKAMRSSRWKAA